MYDMTCKKLLDEHIRQKSISEGLKITFYLKKPVFESSEV